MEKGTNYMEESTIKKRTINIQQIINKYSDLIAVIVVLAMLPFAIGSADRLLAL